MSQEIEKRARIYTVAPECYEALLELLTVLQLNVRLDSPLWKEALAKAEDVIKKVEGEQP